MSKYQKPFAQWSDEEVVDEYKILQRVVGGRCFGVHDVRNLTSVIELLKERGLLVDGHLARASKVKSL